MLKTLIGALALTAALPAAATTDAGQQESVIVRYDDLNLANPTGMERLERRINAAARQVCGVGSASRTRPGEFAQGRACMAAAKAKAAKQVAALEIAPARGG